MPDDPQPGLQLLLERSPRALVDEDRVSHRVEERGELENPALETAVGHLATVVVDEAPGEHVDRLPSGLSVELHPDLDPRRDCAANRIHTPNTTIQARGCPRLRHLRT